MPRRLLIKAEFWLIIDQLSLVVAGDTLTIKFGNKTETVKVNQIVETTKKSEAENMYKIIDETYAENFD